MPLIQVPQPLEDKLGPEATDGLITLLNNYHEQYREEILQNVDDRFSRKVEAAEYRIKTEIKEELHDMENRINLRFEEVQKQFIEVEKRFGEIQKQFGEIQKQITSQTRWLIALGIFIASVYKALDILIK